MVGQRGDWLLEYSQCESRVACFTVVVLEVERRRLKTLIKKQNIQGIVAYSLLEP